MQIVINIDKEDYEKIRETSFVENTEIMLKQSSEDRKGTMMLFRVIDAIKKGTLLPKGHGDLIDKSELTTVTEIKPDGSEITYVPYSEIEEANVMIKADKENTDERNSD